MRKYQITIKLDMFGDQAWDGHYETIGLYADADTPYEALSVALYELLGALQQQGHKLPSFGVRHHTSMPSVAGLTEEQKNEIWEQRKAEQREQEMCEAIDKRRTAEEADQEE